MKITCMFENGPDEVKPTQTEIQNAARLHLYELAQKELLPIMATLIYQNIPSGVKKPDFTSVFGVGPDCLMQYETLHNYVIRVAVDNLNSRTTLYDCVKEAADRYIKATRIASKNYENDIRHDLSIFSHDIHDDLAFHLARAGQALDCVNVMGKIITDMARTEKMTDAEWIQKNCGCKIADLIDSDSHNYLISYLGEIRYALKTNDLHESVSHENTVRTALATLMFQKNRDMTANAPRKLVFRRTLAVGTLMTLAALAEIIEYPLETACMEAYDCDLMTLLETLFADLDAMPNYDDLDVDLTINNLMLGHIANEELRDTIIEILSNYILEDADYEIDLSDAFRNNDDTDDTFANPDVTGIQDEVTPNQLSFDDM